MVHAEAASEVCVHQLAASAHAARPEELDRAEGRRDGRVTMIIILRRGMLLSDRLYKPGDTLPDTEEARILARRGDAEVIEPAAPAQKTAKPAKTKPTPEPKPDTQESDSADGTGNS